jgi:hypothetical protein
MSATAITMAATAVSSAFANYVLAEIRCTELRVRIAANEVAAMQVALRAGLIDPDSALTHLHDVGVLHLLGASS